MKKSINTAELFDEFLKFWNKHDEGLWKGSMFLVLLLKYLWQQRLPRKMIEDTGGRFLARKKYVEQKLRELSVEQVEDIIEELSAQIRKVKNRRVYVPVAASTIVAAVTIFTDLEVISAFVACCILLLLTERATLLNIENAYEELMVILLKQLKAKTNVRKFKGKLSN